MPSIRQNIQHLRNEILTLNLVTLSDLSPINIKQFVTTIVIVFEV